ncbi:MAG: MATE family efflux transporter, partial [Eubacterium sp.]|nr:MATE family efflux transporter [Eubacterium sp.]
MKQYSSKYEKMAHEPIRPLIVSLSVPTIITMLVSALYNMADSFFVGRIDTTSVASIGIVFSVMTLLQALGFFLGHGSGIMLSTMLGKKEILKARQYASTAFFLSLITGIILAALGLFFSDRIAGLLGATSTTLKNASDYLRIILIGSPFILSSFVLNNHLRYQGSAVYSMAGIMSGSILNIIIDPVFIFRLNMGVKGAALAT